MKVEIVNHPKAVSTISARGGQSMHWAEGLGSSFFRWDISGVLWCVALTFWSGDR
jgi:hypothetical protein